MAPFVHLLRGNTLIPPVQISVGWSTTCPHDYALYLEEMGALEYWNINMLYVTLYSNAETRKSLNVLPVYVSEIKYV